jgi:hypothetical protein
MRFFRIACCWSRSLLVHYDRGAVEQEKGTGVNIRIEPRREALVKLLSQRLIQNSGRRENFGWPGIVLIETQDDAAFIASEQDKDGVRYASRIQTWRELDAGDARQRETAKDLYQTIITTAKA